MDEPVSKDKSLADYDNDELDRFPSGFPGKSSADWGWVQHMHASLKSRSGSQQAGRAAVVLDSGAASRGSGNAGTNKEKTVRQWFVDQDLIESVLYLPENLFYNTTAPRIVLFLNRAKPKTQQGKVLLVNASQVFEIVRSNKRIVRNRQVWPHQPSETPYQENDNGGNEGIQPARGHRPRRRHSGVSMYVGATPQPWF